jgi:aminoglycoside phosphotransferase (APT) family kinase protein
VPQRITVDVEQVRRLVGQQFPRWADHPVRPVASGGWDNWTFHLGAGMLVRLPSASEYALAVDKEHRWLPVLAPQLPLPIPVPLAKGVSGAGYPYSWSVYQWLGGEPASASCLADPGRFAVDLAGFLAALRSIDPADGPRPGKHNWFRGGTLRTYERQVQNALAELDGHIDAGLAREIWNSALDARWDGAEAWFHGDVAAGNLLLRDGQLAAVIDFGTCGVGDPACDLAIAWTMLTAESRHAFRQRLLVDEAAWARGRGWALWKTLVACAYTVGDDEVASARRVLAEIFSEYTAGSRSWGFGLQWFLLARWQGEDVAGNLGLHSDSSAGVLDGQ